MNYEYVTWNRFYRLCGVLYQQISDSGYAPDLIIAIARGGYPVARVIADFFGVMDLVSLKIEHYRGPERQRRAVVRYPLPVEVGDRRVLLVDDVSDSGDTFGVALPQIARRGPPAELRTAVLHHKQTSSHVPDYCARRVVKWRWITYPWAVVEDVTVLASRMTPIPKGAQELADRLAAETGLTLPRGVLVETAPIVLQRLADARCIGAGP
jgi:hypoxanthine phosphoribosyltransferase